MDYDVIIIGAGIIGLSTAWQLLRRNAQLKVAVLEKESVVAQHQTGHNSGVIHAGVYYPPGSLKAKFCVEGCFAMKQFCHEEGIAYQEVGKMIAASSSRELSRMEDLALRCEKNGLTVSRLTREAAKELQPGLECSAAFLVKETGIVDYKQVCQRLADLFLKRGGKIFTNESVVHLVETSEKVVVRTHSGINYQARYLIAAAGLYSDRLVKRMGLPINFKIIPFRGEYYKLNKQYDGYFKQAIYPVPNPQLPFLGVHFTPQVSGITTVGPNAVLALAREGYRWLDVNVKDCWESMTFLPVWKMLAKNFRATVDEVHGSLSKNHYLKLIKRYFPHIQLSDLEPYPAGVRAQAMDKSGNLVSDFLFVETTRTLHTCNAPSPAATSSLPIGRYLVDKLSQKMEMVSCKKPVVLV